MQELEMLDRGLQNILEMFGCGYLSSNSDVPVTKALERYSSTWNKSSLKIVLFQFRYLLSLMNYVTNFNFSCFDRVCLNTLQSL